MTTKEAVELLHNAYHRAPYGKQVVSLHLFGIQYAHELRHMQRISASSRNALLKKLLREADIGVKYTTEIAKGINIAEYVNLKTDKLWF